ncbi:MAG TPA: acyl-CoA dehydrogenase family protein, partial [Actinomycetes bacterium]|nr:acyl-CoA dehydrogenase family protein [Actinomycetes bacterium]
MMSLDSDTTPAAILDAIRGFAAGRLPDERRLELDARDEFPENEIRAMCGDELGIHLLFIPEAYEGMGGHAAGAGRPARRYGPGPRRPLWRVGGSVTTEGAHHAGAGHRRHGRG